MRRYTSLSSQYLRSQKNIPSLAKFSSSAENIGFLEMVHSYFNKAVLLVPEKFPKGINDPFADFFRKANCTIQFSINLKREKTGKFEQIQAFRAHHKYHQYPCKGGIRFHQDADQNEVEALALLMTMKNNVANLPYAGAKGAVKINPRLYTVNELEEITRRYTQELVKYDFIGPNIDVPGPDVGTGTREMDWLQSEYERLNSHQVFSTKSVCTGKSLLNGGISGRTESTGLGVYYAIREVLNNKDAVKKYGIEKGIPGKTFIVQGFGNVGYYVSKYLVENGAKLIGVVEYNGSVYNPNGISPDQLKEYQTQNGKVVGFKDCTSYETDEAMYKECDIFIPAALEKSINVVSAPKLKCKIIAEGANGPTTLKGEQILEAQNIMIIPDILANCGGVTISYMEFLTNLDCAEAGLLSERREKKQNEQLLQMIVKEINQHLGKNFKIEDVLDEETEAYTRGAQSINIVNSLLENTLINGANNCIEKMLKKDSSLRMGAWVNSLEFIHDRLIETGFTDNK